MMGGMRQPAPPKADEGKATSLLDALHIDWDNGRSVWDAFNPHPEFASVIQEFIFVSPKSGTRGASTPGARLRAACRKCWRPSPAKSAPCAPPIRSNSSRSCTQAPSRATWSGRNTPNRASTSSTASRRRPACGKTGPTCWTRGGTLVMAAHITADTPENPYKLNVVFVTDIDLISDWFFYNRARGETNLEFDNVTFVLNAVDVLAGDNKFLALRKRRPKLRTLAKVESFNSTYINERIQKIKEADDEAKKLLQKAQHQFDDKRKAIENDPKLSPDEKDELTRRLKEGEERRLDVAKAGIDRQKQQEIDEVKNSTERNIQKTETWVWRGAMALTLLPALLVACVVFVVRTGQEQRTLCPNGGFTPNNAKSDRRLRHDWNTLVNRRYSR